MNGYMLISEPLLILLLIVGGILISHLYNAIGELRSFTKGMLARVVSLEQRLSRLTYSMETSPQRSQAPASKAEPEPRELKLPRHITEEPAVPPPPVAPGVPDIPPPPDIWDSKEPEWETEPKPADLGWMVREAQTASLPGPPAPRPKPAAAPAPAPVKREKPATPAKPAFTWEEIIGGVWLNRLGIVAVEAGIIFFLIWASANNVLTPAWRTALVALNGLGLIALGSRMYEKETIFSQSLVGGGFGALYIAIFNAAHMHVLYTLPSLIAVICVSTWAGWYSLKKNTPVMATIALIGTYLLPLLAAQEMLHSSRGADFRLILPWYLLAISGMTAWIAHKGRWPVFNTAAMTAAYALFALSRHGAYTAADHAALLGFLMFYIIVPAWRTIYEKREPDWFDSFLYTANPLIFHFVLLISTGVNPMFSRIVPLAIATVYGALAAHALATRMKGALLPSLLSGIAVLFSGIFLMRVLEADRAGLILLMEAAVLTWLSRRRDCAPLIPYAHGAALWGAVLFIPHGLFADPRPDALALLNPPTLSRLAFAGVLWVIAHLQPKRTESEIYAVASHIPALIAISSEALRFAFPAGYSNYHESNPLIPVMTWMTYALALFAINRARPDRIKPVIGSLLYFGSSIGFLFTLLKDPHGSIPFINGEMAASLSLFLLAAGCGRLAVGKQGSTTLTKAMKVMVHVMALLALVRQNYWLWDRGGNVIDGHSPATGVALICSAYGTLLMLWGRSVGERIHRDVARVIGSSSVPAILVGACTTLPATAALPILNITFFARAATVAAFGFIHRSSLRDTETERDLIADSRPMMISATHLLALFALLTETYLIWRSPGFLLAEYSYLNGATLVMTLYAAGTWLWARLRGEQFSWGVAGVTAAAALCTAALGLVLTGGSAPGLPLLNFEFVARALSIAGFVVILGSFVREFKTEQTAALELIGIVGHVASAIALSAEIYRLWDLRGFPLANHPLALGWSLLLTVYSAALFRRSNTLRDSAGTVLSLIMAGGAILFALLDIPSHLGSSGLPYMSFPFIVRLAAVGAIVAIGLNESRSVGQNQELINTCTVVGNLLALAALLAETPILAARCGWDPLAASGVVNLTLVLYAAGLIWYGAVRNVKLCRAFGLIVFGCAIAKFFIFDVGRLETLWRFVSWIGLGAMMIVASWFYQARLRSQGTGN